VRPIIIGAGRGSRLQHLTDDVPKTMVHVLGRPMLDSILDALAAGGFAPKDVVYVCGYRQEVIRARHPEFTFVENVDWERNNILASLLCAREFMREGFVATYSDIVYRPQIVADLVASPADVALACDTEWRRRYRKRSQHPDTDAEKVNVDGDRVTRLSRAIAPDDAPAEFIGVMKASPAGAARFVARYDALHAANAGGEWRGRPFEKAYLLDMLDDLAQQGERLAYVPTPGWYMEIDTLEDRSLAETWWWGGG
jgi:choline kinase